MLDVFKNPRMSWPAAKLLLMVTVAPAKFALSTSLSASVLSITFAGSFSVYSSVPPAFATTGATLAGALMLTVTEPVLVWVSVPAASRVESSTAVAVVLPNTT